MKTCKNNRLLPPPLCAIAALMLCTNANAEVTLATGDGTTDAKISPSVDFVGAFSLSNKDLDFGVVLNPESGQNVVVDKDTGFNSSESTATLLSPSMAHAGQFTVSGNIETLIDNHSVRYAKLRMPYNVNLYSTENGNYCGTVYFDGDINVDHEGVYPYGGDLLLATSETGLHCTGSGEVTLIAELLPTFPGPSPKESGMPNYVDANGDEHNVYDDDDNYLYTQTSFTDPETGITYTPRWQRNHKNIGSLIDSTDKAYSYLFVNNNKVAVWGGDFDAVYSDEFNYDHFSGVYTYEADDDFNFYRREHFPTMKEFVDQYESIFD